MNPPISIRLQFAKPPQGGGDPVAMMAALAEPNERMRGALSLGLQKLAFRAQKERFTGQGPFPVSQNRLGVVSGRLRRDLHSEPAEITGRGYSGRIGAAVEYYGAHELGFSGTVNVPAHKRDARTVDRKAQTRTTKSGKAVSIRSNQFSLLPQSVRAHTRKVTIPKRAPLATAITQHGEAILGAEISKVINNPESLS